MENYTVLGLQYNEYNLKYVNVPVIPGTNSEGASTEGSKELKHTDAVKLRFVFKIEMLAPQS